MYKENTVRIFTAVFDFDDDKKTQPDRYTIFLMNMDLIKIGSNQWNNLVERKWRTSLILDMNLHI